MTKDEFEHAILDLWLKTQIPLTAAHLQYYTKESRKQIGAWLDELTVEGTVDMDVDDGGQMVYRVPGAQRPPKGPTSFADWTGSKKSKAAGRGKRGKGNSDAESRARAILEDIETDVIAGQGAALAKRAKKELSKPTKEGEKSLAWGAGLGLLGPVGWFYSGSLVEAGIGTLIFLVAWNILPSFLLGPLLMLALPASAIVGGLYTWKNNKNAGERQSLFLGSGDDDDDA